MLRDIALIYFLPALVFLLVHALCSDLWIRFAVSLPALGLVLFVSWKRYGPQFVAFLRDPVAAIESQTT